MLFLSNIFRQNSSQKVSKVCDPRPSAVDGDSKFGTKALKGDVDAIQEIIQRFVMVRVN